MAEFDPSRAVADFDPERAVLEPPPPPRGALAEVGTGAARGALVGLPTLAGQALQFASSPGNWAYDTGKGMVASAEERGQKPSLTLQPEGRGMVTNALASGAEMLAPGLAVPLAIGGGVAAAGASPFIAGAAAIAGSGALFGAQQGQATLDKAEKAGIDPNSDTAQTAARINAAQTFATQTALGAVGGSLLGVFGKSMGSLFTREAGPLAESTLKALAGTQGVFKPLVKQLPVAAAEGVALNMGQAALSQGIENAYGIDNASPWDVAKEQIGPTLGMTALLGPLGLVARGAQVRSAQARTSTLANGETSPEIRAQLAGEYAAQLAKVDPAAAGMFRMNANLAIEHKLHMDVDSTMFDPTTMASRIPVSTEPTTSPGAAPPGLGARPPNNAPEILAPNWDTTPGAAPPNDGIPFVRDIDTSSIEIAELHTQVKQALVNAGEQPAAPLTSKEFAKTEAGKGLKGQKLAEAYRAYTESPETLEGLRLQDADRLDATEARQREEAAAAATPRNPPPQDTGVPADPSIGRVSLSEAMTTAIKTRDEARAVAEREAAKARETEAIANVTKGAELAAAAGRGEVLPDANAPKRIEDVVADWTTAMTANEMDTRAQSRVPFEKRVAALGLDKMKTHQEQIDALKGLIDDKKVTQGMKDRVSMLVGKWEADMPPKVAEKPADTAPAALPTVVDNLGDKPPAQAALLGENIPPGAPDTRGQPPQAAAVTDTMVSNIPAGPITMAHAAADKAMGLRVQLNDRMRGGEKLTPLEKERHEDLAELATQLSFYTEGTRAPNEGFVRELARLVDTAGKPYTKSLRMEVPTGPIMPDSVSTDMGILAPAAMSGKAVDVAKHFIAHGSDSGVKTLAAKLEPLLGDTRIEAASSPDGSGMGRAGETTFVGEYWVDKDSIDIYPRGASEQTVLHEMVHAVTSKRANEAAGIGQPKNQREAELEKGYTEIEAIRLEAAQSRNADKSATGQRHYGLTNYHEFLAELHANPDFQDFLRSTGGPRNLWARTVDAVRRLLGMEVKDTNLLDRALRASEVFFSAERMNKEFDSSPLGAANMVGESLLRTLAAADSDRTPFTKMSDAVFSKSLPWKTMEFIAHQTRVNPEMVAFGLSKGVDAQVRADAAHRVAIEHLRTPNARYVGDIERAQRALGDPVKAQAMNAEMAYIGMEASRVGFDFRKNFKDQIDKASLDPKDKPFIDDIHRRFTQLQRTNPEIAKLIEQGERQNRTLLLDTVSTIATSAMDARAGHARRLAADLERVPPGDAKRAVLESQVQAITLESTFAALHSKGLDFMDPTLRDPKAKNPDPVRFQDAAAAQLASRLEAAFKAARALPEGTLLRDHMAAMESYYSAQVKNPYFSLGREGDYFVKVGFKDIDAATNARIQEALKGTNKVVGDLTRGDDHAYFRVDNADQAKALGERLVAAGQGKVIDSAWGKQSEKVNDALGAAPALRSLLATLDDAASNTPGLKPEQAALMKETITRQVLSMLPETASRSASMGRRGVPGYDADFLGSFARRANAGVHDVAGLYTNRAYAEAARLRAEAVEQMNRTGSAQGRVRAQEIDSEINKRFANNMKPTGDLNTAVGQATSLAHGFYLGLSPAHLIRTTAQPWHLGLPIIGSKFGYGSAMVELFKAQGTALQVMANSVKAATRKDGARGLLGAPVELQGLNLSPKDQAFVNEMHLRGELELGEGTQLMAAGEGGNQRLQGAVRVVGTLTQMAEMTNRLAMGLAAFRLAEKRPNLLSKGETSTEYALRAVNRGMHKFDPANTARAMGKHGVAGPITPLLTQFQQYSAQTIQTVVRVVHDGFFGQDKSPEGLRLAKEAKRELAGLMATTGMLAGGLGLPFASVFAGAYNMLMSDPDDPKDVRISIRNWAADTFGKDVAGVLLHGPGNVLGVDTASFGLQGLLPGTDFIASRMMWKERADAQMRSAMGPAVSLGTDMFTAIGKMADGQWLKGIEAALPIGLRTYFKTADLAARGYTDAKGNPISVGGRPPGEVGASDIAWRALGFQTAEKADQGEAARDFITNQRLLRQRRGQITDQYIKALRDPSVLADAGQELQAFNVKNPTQPITSQDVAGSIRQYLTGQALAQASGTGVSVSKRQYPTLVENERFAAMPGR